MNAYQSFAAEVLANDEHATVWPDTVKTLSITEVYDDDGSVIGHDATAEIWPGDVYRFQWRESFPTWCRVREIAPNPTQTTPTTEPTTLEIVRNIENGHRKHAAEQITTHSEPARMAIAVLASLASDGHRCDDAQAWHDAAATVVRTLNAGDR